jgi:TonB family protein
MCDHRTMLSILLLAAASPAVIDTGALIPTGKWTVEYAANACVLSRDYGVDRHKITLALRPLPQGTETEVVLLTPGGGRTTVDGYAQLTLLPTARHSVGTYQRVAVDRPDGRVAAMTFDGAALDGLDKATSIELGLDNERHLLAVPDIAGAMKALNACQADLLKGWGVDANERATIATPPRGDVARLFPRSRYPEGARQAHEHGSVTAVALVGATGRVEQCSVAVSSGSRALDETSCQVLRSEGQFTPARDRSGQAVAAHLIVPVHWRLPD